MKECSTQSREWVQGQCPCRESRGSASGGKECYGKRSKTTAENPAGADSAGRNCLCQHRADGLLKETHVAAPGKDYEAMLVLGAQVKPDGTPSLQLQWRLEKAAETYRQKKVPVVCGGQGGNEPAPEAVVMRDVLIGLGVDEDMILMDTTSASTHSNIKNAMQLLGGRNVTKVMIITSDYDLPRAIAIAEDNGLTAYGIGAPTKLGLRFWLKNHCREALAWCKYWAVKYTHLPLE